MFGFLRKRHRFDDRKKEEFVDAISTMLEIQLVVTSEESIENLADDVKLQVLGYIYGFTDAALQTIGQDMSDERVGIPVTFQILRRLFPDREEDYLTFLSDHIGSDQAMMLAVMKGGQQYSDFNKGKLAAPMGLARYFQKKE